MKRLLAGSALMALLMLGAAIPAYAAVDGDVPVAAAPVAVAGVKATPASLRLGPLTYISQTMNNCGPASIAEVLGYWGIQRTQDQAQAVLRADGNAGGMAPFGIPSYARSLGMSTLMGNGANQAVIKALVANGFPTIVSQWVSSSDHYGHYREIEGFDDARGAFVSTDSYLGPNHWISYPEFDQIWASGNNRFYVLYPPDHQQLLNSVLQSAGWDQNTSLMADIAIQQARVDAGINAPQGYGFRRGYSSLTLAWDYAEFGDVAAAQRALDAAKAQGGLHSIQLQWIAQEISARSGTA